MASHVIIKPVRHAGTASQDTVFRSGGVIVEGAPVIFNAVGKVIEATDATGGPAPKYLTAGPTQILGIALNPTTAADQDVLVAIAFAGRTFQASLSDLVAATGSDGGTKALAQTDVGKFTILHKDATTLRWCLAGGTAADATMTQQKEAVVTAGVAGTGTVTYIPQVLIMALVDKIGAKSVDVINFGATGGSGASAPPNTTFQAQPTGSNFGQARVEFAFIREVTVL